MFVPFLCLEPCETASSSSAVLVLWWSLQDKVLMGSGEKARKKLICLGGEGTLSSLQQVLGQ
eukprot:6035776-Amphidinium_carterae.1